MNQFNLIWSFFFKMETIPFDIYEIMYDCCEKGQLLNVAMFLEDDSWQSELDQNVSLSIACLKGHTGIVKLLTNRGGANPADFNGIALRNAISGCNSETIDFLLSQRFNYSKEILIEIMRSEDVPRLVKTKIRGLLTFTTPNDVV